MKFITIILGLYSPFCFGLDVEIFSNGPAVLDANITFIASITSPNGVKPQGMFYFEFTDRGKGGHSYTTEKSQENEVKWTINYPSSKYGPGTYTMEVTVYRIYSLFPFPIPEGTASTKYNITSFINGDLTYTQNNTKGLMEGFVRTGSLTEFQVHLYDPEQFLSKANISYLWSLTDHDNFIPTASPVFKVNFTAPKTYFVQVQVLADLSPRPPPTTTPPPTTATPTTTTSPVTTSVTTTTTVTPAPVTNVTTTTSMPSMTMSVLRTKRDVARFFSGDGVVNMPSAYKYGKFEVAIEARNPVANIEVVGDNWLKQGQVFRVNVTCNGSPMFRYCWEVYVGTYNATGNESCSQPIVADKCSITIVHYFRTTGTYTIPLIISNDVSKEIFTISVIIYDAVKKTNLSMFLVPVACTALAILAMGLGVAFVTKANSRLAVETADFDFKEEEEDAEFMSFTDRLKSALSHLMAELQQQPLLSNQASTSGLRMEYGSTEGLAKNIVVPD